MRFGFVLPLLVVVAASACSKDQPPPPVQSHPPAPAAGPGAPAPARTEDAPATHPERLTDFERTLIAPLLDEIRQGVRPFDEHGFGICQGVGKRCEQYLGTDVGELPPGKYMVRAELKVPNIGPRGTWKVRFETECETTSTQGDKVHTTRTSSTKEYNVVHVGPSRGYRLSPLRVIDSPMTGGTQRCTARLVALHPDGDKVYTVSWTVPEQG